MKTLSELWGHSDVKTTLNRYVHSSFDLKNLHFVQTRKLRKSCEQEKLQRVNELIKAYESIVEGN